METEKRGRPPVQNEVQKAILAEFDTGKKPHEVVKEGKFDVGKTRIYTLFESWRIARGIY